jgi:hypothetical protein
MYYTQFSRTSMKCQGFENTRALVRISCDKRLAGIHLEVDVITRMVYRNVVQRFLKGIPNSSLGEKYAWP